MEDIDMETYVSEIVKDMWPEESKGPLEDKDPIIQFHIRETAMEIGMVCLRAMEKAKKSDPEEVPDYESVEFDDMLKKFMEG